MRNWVRILGGVFMSLWLCGSSLIATQAPDDQEPPARLKKKAKPEAPPAPEKKLEVPPKKAEPPKKGDEAKKEKDEPEQDPAELEQKIKELMNRIGKDMREVENRLNKKDTGDATQQLQRDVEKGIEELIEQSKRQQQQQQQQQAGDSTGSRQQRQQTRANRTRRNRSTAQRQQQQQQQQQAGNTRGGYSPKGEMSKIADVYKDIWGHLPETLRQEMNQYSREQFMAKYNELLKQYYATIAEKGRRKVDGN